MTKFRLGRVPVRERRSRCRGQRRSGRAFRGTGDGRQWSRSRPRPDRRRRLRPDRDANRRQRIFAHVRALASAENPKAIVLPVADALAVVEVGGKRSALLVEVDMGTVSILRMRTKFAGYLAWWKQDGPERRFGLRSLRVFTVAPNENRLARLREAAREATDGKASGLFWFGAHDAVAVDEPERLLAPRWFDARDGAPSTRLFGDLSPRVAIPVPSIAHVGNGDRERASASRQEDRAPS